MLIFGGLSNFTINDGALPKGIGSNEGVFSNPIFWNDGGAQNFIQSKDGGVPNSTLIDGVLPKGIGSNDGVLSNRIFWIDGGIPKLTIKFGGVQKLMHGNLGQILMHGKFDGTIMLMAGIEGTLQKLMHANDGGLTKLIGAIDVGWILITGGVQ